CGREERLGHQRAAELLHDHHHLDRPALGAADLGRRQRAEDPEILCERLPDLGPPPGFGAHHAAAGLEVVLVGQIRRQAAAQQRLLFGEGEIHVVANLIERRHLARATRRKQTPKLAWLACLTLGACANQSVGPAPRLQVNRMDLDLAPADLAFRNEVRAFLDAELTDELRQAGRRATSVFMDKAYSLPWQRILNARGWAAPSWPKEFGGPGWSDAQRYIFAAECARAGAPGLAPMGLRMVGPVIMRYGSP